MTIVTAGPKQSSATVGFRVGYLDVDTQISRHRSYPPGTPWPAIQSAAAGPGLTKWGSIGLALLVGGYWGYIDTQHHLAISAAYMRQHFGWVCATGSEQQLVLGVLTWGLGIALIVWALWGVIARIRTKS